MASFTDGTLYIDLSHPRVTVRGNPVDLHAAALKVLARLVLDPGRVVSNEELGDLTGISPQRIRYVVARLRLKLGLDPWSNDGSPIEQISSIGYRYRTDVEWPEARE